MHFGKIILNFLLPPHCPICHEKVIEPHAICGMCFSKLHFIGDNVCSVCGAPLPLKGSKICGQCLQKKPAFNKAKSTLIYNETSKKLILPFKHSDHLELAPLIAKWMILCGKDLIQNRDIIMPVPLHKRRLFKRKYNQSAILSKIIAKQFCKDYQPSILQRIKNTPTQGHLNFKMRQKNIKGVFSVVNSNKITDKKILLIDDVYTSGATLNECAKVLIKSGAKQVDCLTFCRAGNQ